MQQYSKIEKLIILISIVGTLLVIVVGFKEMIR